ncbi:MAG: VanZ family protein [Sphaerochaetaceae bacterium]|jgi:VanZ family protein
MKHLLKTVGHLLTPIVVVMIAVLSLKPLDDQTLMPLFPYADKVFHFLAYGALACVMLWSMSKASDTRSYNDVIRENWISIILVFSISLIIGISLELVQPVFGRYYELGDIVANAIGSIAGLAVSVAIMVLTHIYGEKDASV